MYFKGECFERGLIERTETKKKKNYFLQGYHTNESDRKMFMNG
jgi:hypothetical protein